MTLARHWMLIAIAQVCACAPHMVHVPDPQLSCIGAGVSIGICIALVVGRSWRAP